MSDETTIRMIQSYEDEASPPLGLSGFFDTPPENFHSSEEIEIDIRRDKRAIAVVLPDISVDYNSTNPKSTPTRNTRRRYIRNRCPSMHSIR